MSKPTATTTSAAPAWIALYALIRALPPVAHPLATLMNGTPVRPSRETSVSASPAAAEPPNAYSTRDHSIPASPSANRVAVRALFEPGHRVATERVHPGTDDQYVSAFDHLGHYSQTV